MISKEEAEEKLLKIFYDVKLDHHYKKKPTHANIDTFEETKNSNRLGHYYKIEGDELVIAMWATSYEHGIPYIASKMAKDSAKHYRKDFFSKHMNLFVLSHLIIPIITMSVGLLTYQDLPPIAIIINILGSCTLIYFIILAFKWKKRTLIRLKELFKNTGIVLSEEKSRKYLRLDFLDGGALSFMQGIIFLISIMSWVVFI